MIHSETIEQYNIYLLRLIEADAPIARMPAGAGTFNFMFQIPERDAFIWEKYDERVIEDIVVECLTKDAKKRGYELNTYPHQSTSGFKDGCNWTVLDVAAGQLVSSSYHSVESEIMGIYSAYINMSRHLDLVNPTMDTSTFLGARWVVNHETTHAWDRTCWTILIDDEYMVDLKRSYCFDWQASVQNYPVWKTSVARMHNGHPFVIKEFKEEYKDKKEPPVMDIANQTLAHLQTYLVDSHHRALNAILGGMITPDIDPA